MLGRFDGTASWLEPPKTIPSPSPEAKDAAKPPGAGEFAPRLGMASGGAVRVGSLIRSDRDASLVVPERMTRGGDSGPDVVEKSETENHFFSFLLGVWDKVWQVR